MVVDNAAYEIGDVLLISNKFPTFGHSSIDSYTDVVLFETVNKFFKREFCYSLDGLFFSDWLTLNNDNLSTINVTPEDSFYINYRYTRSGSETGGPPLVFQSISLNSVITDPISNFDYYYLPNSIFKELYLFNPELSELSSVFTKKLFDVGIIPEYIERGQTNNPRVDDADYIAFCKTLTDFFCIILLFTKKKISGFESELLELNRFMNQRGLYFNDSTDLQDLNYAKVNFFKEVAKRGTEFVFKGKDDQELQGEFLRLIDNKQSDEFQFDLYYNQTSAWCLGKTSPSFRGNYLSKNTIKNLDKDGKMSNVGYYNTQTYQGDGIDTNDNFLSLILRDNYGNISGFNISNDFPFSVYETELTKLIPVDSKIDYEITFKIKQNINVNNITFGVKTFDIEDNELTTKNVFNEVDTKYFFELKKLNRIDTYYFVRGIIYNSSRELISNQQDATLNVGFGTHLKMDVMTSKIAPVLYINNTNSGNFNAEVTIQALQIRPLVSGCTVQTVYSDNTSTPTLENKPLRGAFSKMFLTTNNVLHVMCKNNSSKLSIDDVTTFSRQKLIPYNSILKITEIK
jgi:hypothetical protein